MILPNPAGLQPVRGCVPLGNLGQFPQLLLWRPKGAFRCRVLRKLVSGFLREQADPHRDKGFARLK